MGDPSPTTSTAEKPPNERLDSWKEIAAYLHRDVTTVQRWEKREGMPVHRHLHDKRGSVYAVAAELDAWLKNRKPQLEAEENAHSGEAPAVAREEQPQSDGLAARRWTAIGALAAIGLVVIVYMAYGGRGGHAAAPKIRALAVLPLKNLSGDPAQDYLADGITEELIGRLSNIRNLRVISRTSVMRFKNPQQSIPEIARTLNVDAIVEGSVRRDGNRIRVTAQLIRASTDEHFWSETYDRELRDALSLESDLAQSIVQKVEVTVSGQERERISTAHPVAPEVYESYLQGVSALDKGNQRANIDEAIGYFQRTIQMDPAFAPGYLGLANSYGELDSNYFGEPPDQEGERILSAARKALELDPNLAEGHALIGIIDQQNWQWAAAESEYRRALELNPNDATTHVELAWWLLCRGQVDEALDRIGRARQIDPIAVQGTDIGWMLTEAHHYDDAIHELRTSVAAQGDDPEALWDLGIALTDSGRAADAIPFLEKSVALSNRSPGVTGALIRAYALAGRRNDALRLLAELKKRKEAGYVPSSSFVNAYLGLGDYDQVFAWLEQGYRKHSNILQLLKVAPELDPIRSDPRFADLVHRVGLD